MKASAAELDQAQSTIRRLLQSLLGPELEGVNAFGLTYDRAVGGPVVRVDIAPSVARRVRAGVPDAVGTVTVRVNETSL